MEKDKNDIYEQAANWWADKIRETTDSDKISDGKIQEEEVNSYDTSGKTAFVYNRPKTIQQIIDDLSGETAKTNTETLSAASTTKKAIEGSWTSYTGNDPSMEYSSKYTLVFNSDGTVSCKGYKNNHSGADPNSRA